ncbi:class I SAM-dependent methyltransferase [Paradevosia shaoguanensis]|uniref:class I SAM-dependent methyltransferase n=1 Tax=Paradevosia shaoguanensis TaxID=1335043 RepID=UPI003C72A33A
MTAPIVFDHDLIVRHLQRRQPGAEDFVTSLALYDLQDRLLAVTRRFEQALIMGPDVTVLPERGETHDGVFSFERAGTAIAAPGQLLLDPEDLALPRGDYDLIVSIFDLQIVNDVPGFLARLRRHLRPDGLLLAAAIGGNTLTELRQAFLTADVSHSGGAYARVAPFIEIKDAGALLQRAGFALPVADVENHVVRYAHPLSLMQELKRLGASNPLADRPERMATASLLAGAAEAYKDLAGDPDGRVRATLEIIWMSGWAPHESQQKPLVPGSAKVSMTRILGDKAGS